MQFYFVIQPVILHYPHTSVSWIQQGGNGTTVGEPVYWQLFTDFNVTVSGVTTHWNAGIWNVMSAVGTTLLNMQSKHTGSKVDVKERLKDGCSTFNHYPITAA